MVTTGDEQRRDLAIKRLKEKHDFHIDLVSYVVVNAMLILIWAFAGHGFFWPIILIGLWGMGLVIHAYVVYGPKEPTEDQIQREMKRLT
jgi:hypothetical protein